MSKNFYHYLSDVLSEYEYKFRVKFAIEIDENHLNKLERLLQKYDLVDIGSVKKSIIQDNPTDFPNLRNIEVYSIDFSINLPISAYILLEEIKKALDINEEYFVVRGSNDPLAQYDIRATAIDELNKKSIGKEKGSILSLNNYEEYVSPNQGEDLYGKEYNTKLLNYLAQIKTNREDNIVEPTNTLFKDIFPKSEQPEDFNKDFDTLKPVYDKKTKRKVSNILNNTSKYGNFNDKNKTYTKVIKSGDTTKVLTQKANDI